MTQQDDPTRELSTEEALKLGHTLAVQSLSGSEAQACGAGFAWYLRRSLAIGTEPKIMLEKFLRIVEGKE